MKKTLPLLLLIALLSFACSNYEKKDLYGSWKNDNWEFTFNEDGSCSCGNNGITQPCTYHTTGNALEINGQNGFQISNISIKSIKNDTFDMEMPAMGRIAKIGITSSERLFRVKK